MYLCFDRQNAVSSIWPVYLLLSCEGEGMMIMRQGSGGEVHNNIRSALRTRRQFGNSTESRVVGGRAQLLRLFTMIIPAVQ